MAENIKFWPIRGTETQIAKQPYYDGKIYFATDTGAIYVDAKGSRHQMGGTGSGSSIVYANATEADLKVDSEDESKYSFPTSVLENPLSIPPIGALIINSDGKFFRVTSVDTATETISATLIVTGGGGGGTVTEPDLAIVPDTETIGSSFTYVTGQNYNALVTVNSDTDEEVDLVVELFKSSDTTQTPFKTIPLRAQPAGEPIAINMGQVDYTGTGVTIRITATAANSKMEEGVKRIFNNIRFVEMRIEKVGTSSYSGVIKDTDVGGLILDYVPYGTDLTLTLHASVDGNEISVDKTLTNANMGQRQSISIPAQEHGTHTINLWVSTEVNGAELSSSEISYEAAWVRTGENTSVIWTGEITTPVIQYENAVIPYMVYDPSTEQYGLSTEVHLYHNGVEIAASPINVKYDSTNWLTWDVTSLYSVGENKFTIVNGVTSKDINVYVTTEGSRDLNLVQQDALVANFVTSGRSNSEIVSKRGVFSSSIGNYTAKFTDFNFYNNGWKDDSDGQGSYLSVANDASVEIPFNNISLNNSQDFTFEIRFRVRNIQKYSTLVTQIPLYVWKDANGKQCASGEELTLDEINANGYTVVLDEDGNKEMNQANPTRKIVQSEEGVAFKYLNSEGYGFCIGTQEAYFNTADRVVNVRYKEDEIINITFVVSKKNTTLYIYLNGILSGAADLNNVPYVTMNQVPFLINSKYCDFDLYKLRVYQTGLTMPNVIHNYLADMRDISLYDQNQLTDVNDDTKLSYDKIVAYNEANPDNPTMPYVVFDSSMNTDDDRLPYVKGGKKKISVSFTNPTADKLLADGEITEKDYYTHCPSFTATSVEIDVQGTSSQGYPRRNYKTKFKKAKTWLFTQGSLKDKSINDKNELSDGTTLSKKWHVDNADLATNVFTWKIDFMESSGSYNTGFANMMGNGLYSKHPINDIGIDTDYRTSVYGFPTLVFHKKADGTYTFIGRYNLNIDKGSNEYYGFEDESEHPYVTNEDGTHPTIADVAECWELRDNQGNWCSFKYPDAESRLKGFGTESADSTTENPQLEVPLHFEYRYNSQEDELDAACDYDPTEYGETIGTNNTSICSWLRGKYGNLEKVFNWLDSTDTNSATNEKLASPVTWEVSAKVTDDDTITYEEQTESTTDDKGNTTTRVVSIKATFTADTKEYRRQKFKNEFSKHFDIEYCSIYFIMTELLLCYDSRGKNMMLASWGPHETGGDYIWYPIFYDIDTQLGINNVGAALWDYNEDATENKTFSTPESSLWTNFFDMFKANILSTYAKLRKGGDSATLSYNTIEGAYLCNPEVFKSSYAMRGERPIIAKGLDIYYKYLAPITEGYYDTSGTLQKGSSGNYLYACQGDRMLSRQLFITNRLNYMDSKWPAGAYEVESTKQEIYMRYNANASSTSDIYLDSNTLSSLPTDAWDGQTLAAYPVPYFDTTPQYTVTPFLDQYISIFYDENRVVTSEAYTPEKYPDGMPTAVESGRAARFKTDVLQQQIVYFPAGDYLSSLGDLSTKYVDSIGLYHGKRLLDITLGSDIPGYYNDLAGSGTIFTLADDANTNNKKTLLKKINLTGLRKLAQMQDVSGSEKLQEFRALNTSLPYAVFAEGAPLDTVHLPKTTTRLVLNSNKNLNHILRETPVILDYDADTQTATYRDHSTYEGLYVEGTTDYDASKTYTDTYYLNTIITEDDALGYDSYEILKNAVDRKSTGKDQLAIQMNNVTWTPYTVVSNGETYDSSITYYELSDHGTYGKYTYTNATDWDNKTLNEKIYTYESGLNESIISDLSLLDKFIEDYEASAKVGGINQFTNTSGEAVASRPTLTGELYVSNANGTAINEEDLTSIYAVHWPQLTIRCAKVNESYLAKYVQIDATTGKETELDTLHYNKEEYEGKSPTLSTKASPYRQYYDFIGWSYEPDGELAYDKATESWTAYGLSKTFSSSQTVITLYAKFSATLYTVHYLNPDGTELYSRQTTYGQPIPDPQEFPTYDPGNLALEEVYSFKGYTREKSNALPTKSRLKSVLLTLSKTSVTEDDVKIYAVYLKQSVYDEPTDTNCFVFSETSYNEQSILGTDETSFLTGDTQYNTTGVSINIKAGVHLTGKVTLPTYSPSGRPVISIGNTFAAVEPTNSGWESSQLGGKDITHIFWYKTNSKESELRMIEDYAFGAKVGSDGVSSLKYVQFPDSLRYIGANAFFRLGSLDASLFELPNNLFKLAAHSFNGAFAASSQTGVTLKIPNTVQSIGQMAFYRLNVQLSRIQFGNAESGSELVSIYNTNVASGGLPKADFFQSSSYSPDALEFYATSETQLSNIKTAFANSSVSSLFASMSDDKKTYVLAQNAH